MNNLLKIRKSIDVCDKRLVDILSRRLSLVRKVALYKKENNLKPLDPKRWQDVLNRMVVLSVNKKIPLELIQSIMGHIHQESLSIEEDLILKKLDEPNNSKSETNPPILFSDKPGITIIGGSGSMGRFFVDIFKKEGIQVFIGSRSDKDSYKNSVDKSDIIILSVPVNVVKSTARMIKPFLRKDQLVVNFSSVQSIYLSLDKELPCSYVGIHPLFGPTVKNIYGQNFVFCNKNMHKWSIFLKNTFERLGAHIVEMDAKSHDKYMALNQALIHVLHISGLETIKRIHNVEKSELENMSTPISRLNTLITNRIFSQSSELYENILMMNPEVAKVITQEISILEEIKNMILKKDRKKFSRIFNDNKFSIGEQAIIDSVSKTNKMLTLLNSDIYKTSVNTFKSMNVLPLSLKSGGKISFLGPLGTYSHIAVEKLFKHDAFFTKNSLIPQKSIIDVFDSVQRGEAVYGVVPVENSTEGIVKDTIHVFTLYDVSIAREYCLPIDHSLMALNPVKNISQINIVKAHSQALGQCRKWLKENVPNSLLQETNSNISGLSDLKENEAIIASKSIASMYGLSIVAENISDSHDNTTMFYVIKRNDKKNWDENKNTHTRSQFAEGKKYILMLEVIDRVGVLRDILDVMVRYGFNLSRIVSIPGGVIGRYQFILDIKKTAPKTDPVFCDELYEELYKYCSSIKLLGIV